jgi:hypothetical protein
LENRTLATPFGEVTLDVVASGDVNFMPESSDTAAMPPLPEGMRVDGFRQAFCTLETMTRGDIAVRMRCALEPECTAAPNTGEWLHAFDVQGPQIVGAFGMNDDDWFAHQPGVDDVEIVRSQEYVLRLQISGARSLTIGVAAAWTLNPEYKWGDQSPWLAVDSALPFK